MSSSPCLTTRTPGQLLSLTSHLSFGSGETKSRNRSTDYVAASLTSNFMNAINRQSNSRNHFNIRRVSWLLINFFFAESPEYELDSSAHKNNDSHVSGVSPFFSSEDINVSLSIMNTNESVSKIKLMEYQTFLYHRRISFQKDSTSSYYTCNSSVGNRTSSCECSRHMSNISFKNLMGNKKCCLCKVKEFGALNKRNLNWFLTKNK